MKDTNHLSLEHLAKNIEIVEKHIPIGSSWVHYKNPDKHYHIMDLVIDEASDEVTVLYQEAWNNIKFVRLARTFLEKIDKDGVEVERFRRV